LSTTPSKHLFGYEMDMLYFQEQWNLWKLNIENMKVDTMILTCIIVKNTRIIVNSIWKIALLTPLESNFSKNEITKSKQDMLGTISITLE